MKEDCERIWQMIVDLSHGETRPEATEHLQGCPECQEKFDEMQLMVARFQAKSYNAPSELLNSVKAMMPATKRTVLARLLRSNLGLAGVRSTGPTDIQALYEADEHKIRIQYRALPKGWEILGQSSVDTSSVVHAGKNVSIDPQGRFQFHVKSLGDSAFEVQIGGAHVLVPSVDEATRNEP